MAKFKTFKPFENLNGILIFPKHTNSQEILLFYKSNIPSLTVMFDIFILFFIHLLRVKAQCNIFSPHVSTEYYRGRFNITVSNVTINPIYQLQCV